MPPVISLYKSYTKFSQPNSGEEGPSKFGGGGEAVEPVQLLPLSHLFLSIPIYLNSIYLYSIYLRFSSSLSLIASPTDSPATSKKCLMLPPNQHRIRRKSNGKEFIKSNYQPTPSSPLPSRSGNVFF